MKRILSLIILMLSFMLNSVNAQNSNDNALAVQLVNKNATAIGLSFDQLSNYKVSNSHFDAKLGAQLVYLQQTYKGLPVYNQMLVLAFKGDKLISNAGGFIKDIDAKTGFQSQVPAVTPAGAVGAAITESKLTMPAHISIMNTLESNKKFDFGTMGLSSQNVTAELMWVPTYQQGKMNAIKLAWEVQVAPLKTSDWWNIRIDANNSTVIEKSNYTVYEKFGTDDYQFPDLLKPRPLTLTKPSASFTAGTGNNSMNFEGNSPSLVTTVNYTVIPYPAESPIHPGGTAAVRTNPWTLAGGNAVSLGWHNDGTTDYTVSRGNNVHAHEDRANNNCNCGATANSTTTPDPLNFTYAGQPNYNQDPTTTGPTGFQQFAITNLFYWNNIAHDATYNYGFDEPAGNFQKSNQGRGGLGNDYVQADAQDGGGTNNANFATPPDGSNPRMQMYLFNPSTGILTFVVNAPAAIAGPYNAVEGAMSTNNLLANVGPINNKQVIYYNDNAASTHDACVTPSNGGALTGKIALINRGNCNFTTKVLNAQNAGAIAVIMVNNVPGFPIVMGGTDNTITIPAIMISDVDGATIAAQLGNNVFASMSATGAGTFMLDGDIDNGVVTHEFFHGVSNRLTGGPANSNCLNNAEEGGEGWSDYNALMLTTNWATATATDGFNNPRPIGNYVLGKGPNSLPGIRNYPYCTNIAVNPLTYANMGTGAIGTEVHNIGEIWCMALWEMTWQIIQTDGINPNFFNSAGAGGNTVAYNLVIAGLKLQPCSPGYIDARNAILTADQNLYGGVHACAIWTAFAKRGMGANASQGSSNSATDQTPDFTVPITTVITTQPTNATVCAGGNTSFGIVAGGGGPYTYVWQVSTAGVGGPYNTISNGGVYSNATTATLNITGATAGMNGYYYHCIATGSCGAKTSNNVLLTVSSSTINAPTVTQPTCAVPSGTIVVNATGSGTLEYSIDNGTTWSASNTFSGLAPGNYNIKVRIQALPSCITTYASNPVVINAVPVAPTVNAPTVTQPSCATPTGSIVVNATGSGTLEYSIDNGTTWSASNTFNGLAPGNYNIKVRLQANPTCVTAYASNPVVLTVAGGPTVNAPTVTQPTCAVPTGTIVVNATGGGTLEYSIDNGTTWFLTNTFSGLAPGNYNIKVRLQSNPGCAVTYGGNPIVILIAGPTVNAPTVTQPTCAVPTGTIVVNATGGGTLEYSINNGVNWFASNTFSGLAPGNYNIVVREQAFPACTRAYASNPVVINAAPAAPAVNQPANQAVCAGSATAAVNFTGTATLYSWTNSTPSIGLAASGTGNIASFIAVNAGSTPVVATITVTPSTNGGTCVGPSKTFTITVNPLPVISIITDNGTTLCQGDPTLMTVVTAPTVYTFCNPANLPVPGTGTSGPANPYPSNIVVSGIPVTATVQSVVLNNISHTWESDMGFVLQSPSGQNVVLMNAINGTENGGFGILNRTYTFSDAAATGLNLAGPTNVSGTYKCSNNNTATNWPAPGPGVVGGATNPLLSTFTGNLNGTWKLFAYDFAGGDFGNVAGGWCMNFVQAGGPLGAGYTFLWSPATGLNATNINPVAASPNATTTYTVNVTNTATGCSGSTTQLITIKLRPLVTTQPVNATNCSGTSASFTVAGTGAGLLYQWQESTNGGVTYTNLNNVPPYNGVNTATLTINPVTVAMNNNRYRCVLTGDCPAPINNPNQGISAGAVLTVNATPVVTVTPSGPICGGIAGTNGLQLTASGANTYTWSPATGLYTNANATTPYVAGTNATTVYAAPTVNTTYTVTGTITATGCTGTATVIVNYTPLAPTVNPSSATMCLGDAAVPLTITSSLAPSTQTFSSGAVNIPIPDGPVILPPAPPASYPATTSVIPVALPAGAVISNMSVKLNITHTYISDLIITLKAPNGAVLNLDAGISKTVPTGANFTNTVISSTGVNALSSASAPFTGTFKPDAVGATFVIPAYLNSTFPGGPAGYVPTVNNFGGLYGTPSGNWTLAIYDLGAGDVGTLNNWSMDITYGVPASGIWTPNGNGAGLFTDAAATTVYTGTPAQTVYAKPAASTTYSVTVTNTVITPRNLTQSSSQAVTVGNSVACTVGPNNWWRAYDISTYGLNGPLTINNVQFAVEQSTTVQNVTATLFTHTGAAFPGGVNTPIPGGTSTVSVPIGSNLNINAAFAVPPVVPNNAIVVVELTVPAANWWIGSNTAPQTAPSYISAASCAINTPTDLAAVGFPGDHIILNLNGTTIDGNCTSAPTLVPVTVNIPVVLNANLPVNAVVCTDKTATFSVAVTAGTSPTYQWQVSANGGGTWTNITNGGVYSGATTATLTITAPPVALNGNQYRCVVSGAAPCGSVTSAARTLTVNPLPTVVITAPYYNLLPGLQPTITSTSTPAAVTYTWIRNGAVLTGTSLGIVSGINTGSLQINIDGMGTYTLKVTDVNGCTNTSNAIIIGDSTSGRVFIYPNPNSGQFQVRYNPAHNNVTPRGINVYNGLGQRIANLKYTLGMPFGRMDVDLRNFGAGVYWIEVVDVNDQRLAVGRAEVLR